MIFFLNSLLQLGHFTHPDVIARTSYQFQSDFIFCWISTHLSTVTKKQKINHHDKIDKECRNEKKLIFKLLIDFVDSTKQLINYCYPRSKDNSKEIMKNPNMILFVQKIQTQFAQTKKRTIDKEQFNALVNPLNLAPNDK